jgi:hypothetical protein|tara:strand:- start:176 stop:466 length:291 start_codon:yes stop_codon:yes gene_type:complete
MELKYDLNYFMAIEGLDDAVIGTASFSTDGEEVLAYDFDKAVEILAALDWTKEEVEAWLDNSMPEETTARYPIFVYRDENVREQLKSQRSGRRTLN